MSKSLSISNSAVAPHGRKTAIKNTTRKAAPPPKKHAPHKNKDKDKHDAQHGAQEDRRRAYLHLARASSLLSAMPRSKALGELNTLFSLCRNMFLDEKFAAYGAAESARALEHLCFVSFAAAYPVAELPLPKPLLRDFERHFQHDLEKQTRKFKEAEATEEPLFELASQSLATAEQTVRRRDWYLGHECLRAADALLKALEQR